MAFSLLIVVIIALLVVGIAHMARGSARRSNRGDGHYVPGPDNTGQHHHHHNHGAFGGGHHAGHHDGGGFGGGGHHG